MTLREFLCSTPGFWLGSIAGFAIVGAAWFAWNIAKTVRAVLRYRALKKKVGR